jgi:hypothetical protein
MHALRIHRLALGARVQILQQRFGARDGRGNADDLKAIAAPSDLDPESGLDLVQVFVQGAAQLD